MTRITQQDIESLYEKIKKKAFKEFHKGNVEQSLKDVSVAATIAYNSNFIYKDDDLENLLSKISCRVLPQQISPFSKSNKYVLIDAFGLPNQGLTQQYLRALIALEVEFLYILEVASPNSQIILDEILNSSKGTFCVVGSGKEINKMKFVYDQITKFQPSAIFAHLTPWDTLATTILYAFSFCTRYNINLTDHAFWLGPGCFDYTLEFRNYGCTVSYEKRGFSQSQILLNPYYPIIDKTAFLGFPSETKGKSILFSGGAYYKIYGKNNAFLRMMKRVLDENPAAILLYAGSGYEKPIKLFIQENKLEERLLLIGQRKDINEVFAHCDIYIGTYPFSGGLMTQYAAYNSKPVVAYVDQKDTVNNLQDLISPNRELKYSLTYSDPEDFFAEVKLLIRDVDYRVSKGREMKSALKTKEQFDDLFKHFLKNKVAYPFDLVKIDYDERKQWYLDVINEASPHLLGITLLGAYSLKSIGISWKLVWKALPKVIEIIKKKLSKKKYNKTV